MKLDKCYSKNAKSLTNDVETMRHVVISMMCCIHITAMYSRISQFNLPAEDN